MFFLAYNQCHETTFVEDCVEYSITSDKCIRCKKGFVLDKDACHALPTFIANCVQYTTNGDCSTCAASFYLKDKACVPVDTLIPQCNSYTSTQACATCEDTYYLKDGACVATTSTNCATFTATGTCQTCPPRFYLDSNSSCVAYPDANCQWVENGACVRCADKLYPSGLTCVLVTNPIPRCVEYASAITCNACMLPYILSTDKKSCVFFPKEYVDLGCKDSRIVTQPVCAMCKLGYFNGDNGCEACPSITGCFACDPKDTTKCAICQSGFYMNKAGDCVQPPKPVDPTPTPTPTPVPDPTTQPVAFSRVLSAFVALALFLAF